jgi:hypothetical protein
MKKTILSLGLLGLIGSAQAQWVNVNQNNVSTPPSYNILGIHTVSPTIAWGITEEAVTGATTNTFVRTSDATGTEFEFNAVSGATGFQTANIHGLTAQTAMAAQFGPTGGGEILRTVDGGNSWRKVSTNTQFAAPAGFNNWVYMFDANEGVSLGDPNGGNFEILRTVNGGTTWTRVPNGNIPQPVDADEYGLVRSYFALGNTIWAGTSHNAGTTALPVRVLKSTDRGLTWTVSATCPLTGGVSRLAFTDPLNGIANAGTVLCKTVDGGANWTLVTPSNTATGRFYWFDIDAVPGTSNFISVGGVNSGAGNTDATFFGSSWSSDGVTWRDIDRGVVGQPTPLYFSVDAISNVNAYAGGRTSSTTAPTPGSGGLYRWGGAVLTPTRTLGNQNAALKSALSVYPNPSSNGVFKVAISAGMKAGATLTVVDALGRQVASQTLKATAIAAETVNLDLSKEKAGVYTLEVRTDAGVAQQKLVIE